MANVRAEFFRDGTVDRVTISIIGDPNTFISKVEPKHVQQFPREWEAYQNGVGNIEYGGTPLTDVPGVDHIFATSLRLNGVHNAEMLAGLSDAAAKGLGMGGLTARNTAQLLLKANKGEVWERPYVAEVPAPVPAPVPDYIEATLAQADDEIDDEAVEAPRRRGRPPKAAMAAE